MKFEVRIRPPHSDPTRDVGLAEELAPILWALACGGPTPSRMELLLTLAETLCQRRTPALTRADALALVDLLEQLGKRATTAQHYQRLIAAAAAVPVNPWGEHRDAWLRLHSAQTWWRWGWAGIDPAGCKRWFEERLR